MTYTETEARFVDRLALIEANTTTLVANAIPGLAGLLPSGYDNRGKHSKINAGQLVDFVASVMQKKPNMIASNIMSQEVEINGKSLCATELENI